MALEHIHPLAEGETSLDATSVFGHKQSLEMQCEESLSRGDILKVEDLDRQAQLDLELATNDTKRREPLVVEAECATSGAHLNRCADRLLLRQHNRGKVNHRLGSQLDEPSGSQGDAC